MKKFSVLVCALVIGAVCCSCDAPLDATGTYSGKWSFLDNETTLDNSTAPDPSAVVIGLSDNATPGKIIDCPLNMELSQDTTLDPPQNLAVNGTVHIDFSCLEEASGWPSWAETPAPTTVTVTGLMDAAGNLDMLSGGCGPGTCVVLALDGVAHGEDGGSLMTRYSGNWGFAIGFAFLGTLGGAGTFEVVRE